MKKITVILSGLWIVMGAMAQNQPSRPKLVVGIVVDQMRYDFLYRYYDKYSDGGFKYLLSNGRSFENMHYNYTPTYTGPGHAAIYTGTTPCMNGIVANDWFDRKTGKTLYVVQDNDMTTIGSTSDAGKMSPNNLLTTTITDELKIFFNERSKVIGISQKDRGAILPAGNMADGAYWMDGKTGNWISSSFYMSQLPQYVSDFNAQNKASWYLDQQWETLLPIADYKESTVDNTPYEQKYKGETAPVFPHDLKTIRSNYNFSLISRTPFGNSYTTDFALEVIKNENLGKDEITDFLAVSYSSTDYVGHQFGINAIETEDTYLRLDLELKRLFQYLEKNVGKGNFAVFITADHGVVNAPGYLKDRRIHAGGFKIDTYQKELKIYLQKEYGEGEWLSYYTNQQVYLNRRLIADKKINLKEVQDKVVEFTRGYEGVREVIPAHKLMSLDPGNNLVKLLQNGYHYQRCGDVYIVLDPQWIDEEDPFAGGTTHGSPYAYDTHVPFIIMGEGITAGRTSQQAYIVDIAPTLAYYLRIMEPSGSVGKVLDLK